MKTLPILLASLAASSCTLVPAGDQAATPQRPTLSSDTNTTAEDTFELEAGAHYDPNTSADTPVTVKYGAGPATEVFASLSPLVYLHVPGSYPAGPSDLTLGIRHRLEDEYEGYPSTAVQATVKLPTANSSNGLGTGELDASFAGIASLTVGPGSVTGYYSLDLLGDPTGGTRVGHSLALAGSVPVAEEVAAFAEVAGVFVPEIDSDQVFATVGATCTPEPATVYDAGVVLGLNDEAPDFQLLLGMTRNLGRR